MARRTIVVAGQGFTGATGPVGATGAGGGGGVTVHGDLTGLADDDHLQYDLAPTLEIVSTNTTLTNPPHMVGINAGCTTLTLPSTTPALGRSWTFLNESGGPVTVDPGTSGLTIFPDPFIVPNMGLATLIIVNLGGTDFGYGIYRMPTSTAGGGAFSPYRITFSDVNYDLGVTPSPLPFGWTVLQQTGTLTAARTVDLPPASIVSSGYEVIVNAGAGASSTNTVTIARAGSDTINGAATSVSISVPWAQRRFTSDGESNWSCDPPVPDSSDGSVLDIRILTQAAYDAIGTKPATTLYFING